MRVAITIACLALLACEPAGAAEEATYSLTVSRHPSVRDFSDNQVKALLRKASEVMRSHGCPVTFKLDGSVRTFSSAGTPNNVVSIEDIKKVHSEPTDVKIVKEIHCCVGRKNRPGGTFEGCSWPPEKGSRSIILTEKGATLGNRWAHELGHRMGLEHRGDGHDLMTGTGLTSAAVQISPEQCRCFLNEGSCTLPPQPEPATQDRCPE